MTRSTITLIFLVLLSGCGPRFSGDAALGEAGEGGEATVGGSGGAGATGGTPSSGGTAGEPGGAAGQAGSPEAGQGGGAGAAAAGGSSGALGGGAGSGGAAGAPTGGTAGQAGSAGVGGAGTAGGGTGGQLCTPEQAIAVPPASFTWPAFSSGVTLDGVEHCASSEGGACTLEVWSFGPEGIQADISCDAEIIEGACGAEMSCGNLAPGLRLAMTFIVAPTDDGNWVTFVEGTTALHVKAGNCTLTASEREGSAEGTLWNAAAELFDGIEWACPVAP